MVNSSELRQRKIDKQNVFSPENEAVEGDFSKEPLIDDNSKYKGKTSLVDTFKKVAEDVYTDESWWIFAVLTLISIVTRFWGLERGDFVVWDEAHFGKFASYYLTGKFYTDLHPPLGKMLCGMAGKIAGYSGDFAFESGAKYPETFNYYVMRFVLTIFGALQAPVVYKTAIQLRFTQQAAVFACLLSLFDIAFLVISRFILLDGMLIFFTITTTFFLCLFINEQEYPFSLEWWFALLMTGISIGLVSSVKWVGFFTMALVGLYTISDLWGKFGDLEMPKMTFVKHFLARAFCLILVPFCVYVFCFALHFAILNNSGPGDAQMSSLFQANLNRSPLLNNPYEVAYGSLVSIKNQGYNGGLLHSHVQTFPSGSKQQQVTCYHHRDTNNDWIIKKGHGVDVFGDIVEFVKNGDTIRLLHNQTGANLHSHRVVAPITKTDWEVSAYGNDSWADPNDFWVVEIESDLRSSNISILKAMTTSFRLRHEIVDCYLRSDRVNLPEWGFKQLEVTCDKKKRKDSYSLWNVEHHVNPKLPANPSQALYKSSFWADFIMVNAGMYYSNNALTPDPDKEPDVLTSKPWEWPILWRGLRMVGWGDNSMKFYLMGNPIVWWGGYASIILILLVSIVYFLRRKRACQDFQSKSDYNWFNLKSGIIVGGWFLHFVPFMILGRVTYLHHYFPALFYAMLGFSFMLDHLLLRRLKSEIGRWLVVALLGGVVISVFAFFSPLAYGYDKPASDLKNRQWLSSWNLV